MKNKILKILEECKSKGYDDLQFESDREYIAERVLKAKQKRTWFKICS